MSEELTVDPSAPVTTEQPAAAPVEKQPETVDQTMDRVAAEIFDGKRGPDGRFQSRVAAPGAPETAKVPGSPQAAPPDPAPQVIEAPQSLPADVKAKWATLPPDVQSFWAKREGEIHQKFTTDGERLKSYSAFEEVLKPLEQRLKQVNAPAHEYVRRLAAADQLLATDGIRGLQQIAQMYGLDIRAAAQNDNQPGPQPTPQVPDIDRIVEEKLTARQRENDIAARQSEIEKFKAALPADEQADFDRLTEAMAGLVPAFKDKPLTDLYQAARRADPETLAKDEAKKTAEATKKAEEEAKKKAAQDARLGPHSRRPGSTPTAPIKGATWQDTMDRVGKEVLARN